MIRGVYSMLHGGAPEAIVFFVILFLMVVALVIAILYALLRRLYDLCSHITDQDNLTCDSKRDALDSVSLTELESLKFLTVRKWRNWQTRQT